MVSVANAPGNILFMVTLCIGVCRDSPAIKPVSPARAPFDSPKIGIGAFTAAEVILTIRPNFRSIIPSNTVLINSIGVSMFACSAFSQSVTSKSLKSPAGGPPALLIRISSSPGQASSVSSRPSDVVISAATVLTSTFVFERICSEVSARASTPRATITTLTPSSARDSAHALPNPLLPAQTKPHLPLIPKSIIPPST